MNDKPAPTPEKFLDGEETLDRRPRFEVPKPDDELAPIMRLLDDCLMTGEAEPPMRSPLGWPVEVREHEPLGMHELISAGANDEEGEFNSRLPPPKILTLAPHTTCSLALALERYVAFYRRVAKKKAPPAEVPKRLPTAFVNHYLEFAASRLPRVAAVTTTPLVLPNGRLLATSGLDRERRIVFRIAPEVSEWVPTGRVGGAAVAHAMRFLTDEWLIDVQTDYAGKCVILALALTIIERPLFAERPAYFVTSGKRGGGKTTVINMVSSATLGKRAAAMAWSRLEEERRKTIFAAFLQGAPLVVFDNISRGAALSCPMVEKALTSAEIEDRVLGASRDERVASTAPLAFTGNNITPKGDMASRSLMARIVVDRPDPENRTFTHPDPFAWTRDHRGEILEALYTVLIGNPRLYGRSKGEEKTRFKLWQRVVGAAIEHAAELAGQGVDFARVFAQAEGDDEETASLAEAMECLDKRAGGKPFKSADVLEWAAGEGDDARAIRGFLISSGNAELTTKGITYKLKAAADAPIRMDDGVWTLRANRLGHANLTQFHIAKANYDDGSVV
jgi:hypothetical protein